jgi:hypothetical protein
MWSASRPGWLSVYYAQPQKHRLSNLFWLFEALTFCFVLGPLCKKCLKSPHRYRDIRAEISAIFYTGFEHRWMDPATMSVWQVSSHFVHRYRDIRAGRLTDRFSGAISTPWFLSRLAIHMQSFAHGYRNIRAGKLTDRFSCAVPTLIFTGVASSLLLYVQTHWQPHVSPLF